MLFEEYVAARGHALLRFAYVLTTDSYAAEDLVQSALADAYRHWRKVSKADHPDAYVRRIIVNTHLGWRRRRWTGERAAGMDLDAAAIADLLQLSPSTVRSTASRALATLRHDHPHLAHADTAEEH